MSGTEKLVGLLSKLIDNTHAGKLFTDFAPGLILTGALLLVVSAFTAFEVVPYPRAATYEAELAQAQADLSDARDRVVELKAEIAGLRVPKASESDPAASTAAELARKEQLLLYAQDEVTARAADVTARRTRRDQAVSLSGNVASLNDNLAELLGFSLVLGAILAQVSGKVFWNGLFWRHLETTKNGTVHAVVAPADMRSETYWRLKASKELSDRLPDLDATYFRYAEVAMNAILPMGALALALGAVACFDQPRSLLLGMLAALTLAIAVVLYLNAQVLHVGYFMKKADLITALKEDVAAQKAAPVPPAKP